MPLITLLITKVILIKKLKALKNLKKQVTKCEKQRWLHKVGLEWMSISIFQLNFLVSSRFILQQIYIFYWLHSFSFEIKTDYTVQLFVSCNQISLDPNQDSEKSSLVNYMWTWAAKKDHSNNLFPFNDNKLITTFIRVNVIKFIAWLFFNAFFWVIVWKVFAADFTPSGE